MGQTSFPPNAIIVTSAGLVGASASGSASTLSAADARTLLELSTNYLALSGGTLTGPLNGTSLVFSGEGTFGSNINALEALLTGKVQASSVWATNGMRADIWNNVDNSATVFQYIGGNLRVLINDAAPLIQLCGTTASYPAIKRNGTAVNFRLADESGDAPITAASITVTETVGISALSSTSTLREQYQFVGSWVTSTDATRKAQVEEKVYDTAARTVARSFADGTNGYKALKVLATAPADADLAVSEVVFYTDGSGNLAIKLKDSGGTVRTGTVTLT
jgi:hypothetical protein